MRLVQTLSLCIKDFFDESGNSGLNFLAYPITGTNRGYLPGLHPLNSQLRGELQRAIRRKGFQPVAFSLCCFFACLLFPSKPLPDNSRKLCQIGNEMSRVSAFFVVMLRLTRGQFNHASQKDVSKTFITEPWNLVVRLAGVFVPSPMHCAAAHLQKRSGVAFCSWPAVCDKKP
jgi:hypothetical protein